MLRIAETHALTASLSEIAIAIDLPAEMAAQWMNSDAVGIYQSVQVDKGQILKVTIEKTSPVRTGRMKTKPIRLLEWQIKTAIPALAE